MLNSIAERARDAFHASCDHGRHHVQHDPRYDHDEFYYTGYYYPGLPVVREVPDYVHEHRGAELEKVCSKHAYNQHKRTPGVQACICLDCLRVVGFNAMHEAESARSVFEVVFSRFPTAPDVIIYDNACNLSQYCHTRESYFFRDTCFVIDKLH
jgi:hypothetical protein